MSKQPKKEIFSQEIDSRIAGFALIITFMFVGIFLLIFPNYFGSLLAASIIRWIFIALGALGFIAEMAKFKEKIPGISDISGVFILIIWLVVFLLVEISWVHSIIFLLLIFGIYGVLLGSFKVVYALRNRNLQNKVTSSIKKVDILLVIAQLLGIGLVIVQLVTALSDIM